MLRYFNETTIAAIAIAGCLGFGVYTILAIYGPAGINSQTSRMMMGTGGMGLMAQPVGNYPVPVASKMFTNDTAFIKRFNTPPYILDMAQVPREVTAQRPTLFVFNLFDSANNVWLWHSDMRFVVTGPDGQPQLVLPNLHGHGSMIQLEYVFPTAGIYNVDIIFGQQTGSPNYMIQPKVIKEVNFDVTVMPKAATIPLPTGTHLKDIAVAVQSWKYTPNVISVNKGDLVRLHFTTAQDEVELYNGHGFGIEGYNVNVFLTKGTQQTVQFLADKAGTFTFRCTSFCSAPEAAINDHFNMVGKLIVHA
jgi:heme/copper-type cytochrome/quinol oxidase subunit 2